MRKLIIVGIAACLVLAGCATPQQPSTAPSESSSVKPNPTTPEEPLNVLAGRYGLSFVGGGDDTTTVLPADVEASSEWGVVQSAVVKDGYDLRPYAGESVRVSFQPLEQRSEGARARFVAVVHEGKTIAAYAAVEDSWPGILALSEIGQPAARTK